MSQIIKPLTSAGPIPPVIPTKFTTNDGFATPSGNNLNVFTSTTGVTTASTDNNTKGVTTSASGSTVNTILTNRYQGSATTSGAAGPGQTANLYSINIGATSGTYLFFTRVVAYNTTTNKSSAYASYRCIRNTAGTLDLVSAQSGFEGEDTGMAAATAANGISGTNVLITVTGIPDESINWYALTEFTFVGAV